MSSIASLSLDAAPVDFTVAIPTFNGASRIVPLLERLRSQHSSTFTWEILVIDNNSHDRTAEVIRHYQADWDCAFPLRYCFEPQQGLAFARQRAIMEARGRWVGFLDDDTRPAADWVTAAYAFGEARDTVGAFGGQIHAEFETAPPQNFKRIQSFLAIKERGSQPHRYQPDRLILPPGAGLVVRRQAWLASVPQRLIRTQRGGNDFEISLHLHRAGWEIWYNPEMHLYHYISADRLEKPYLLSLVRTAGLCICQIRLIGTKTWEKPLIFARILLGNLRRAIAHWIQYRGQIQTDLVAACEMEFFLSGLVSPFYCLKKSGERAVLTIRQILTAPRQRSEPSCKK